MEDQIDLIDILMLLWKKKFIIIIVTLIFALVAFLKFGVIDSPKAVEEIVEEQKYYAQTIFTVGNFDAIIKMDGDSPANINIGRDTTDAFVETCNEIIKSQKILNNVITNLNLDITVQNLKNLVSVCRLNTSNAISIIVASDDESQAIKIADEIMSEFSKFVTFASEINQVVVIDNAHVLSGQDLAIVSGPVETSKPNVAKKVCIISLVGFVLSAGGVIIVNFLSNTINNENDIDTKLLGIIENKKSEDVFNILRIKLEKNQAMVITSFENNEKITSVINRISDAFEKNNKKVLLLDSKELSSTSDNELKNYDYVIVNAKNILEDASSLMAVKQIKNTVLVVTERKTKLNVYKRVKETLNDVDANLLGSILMR